MSSPQKQSALLRLCRSPITSLPPSASVGEAVQQMVKAGVGAIAIVEEDRLVGLFTERDLLVRVVAEGRDPRRLPVAEVMTSELHMISASGTHAQAAQLMLEAHCRHLPVMLEGQRLGGILSIRHLYRDQLRRLRNEMSSLQGFLSADGPGG